MALGFYWDRCDSTVLVAAALLALAFVLGLIAALITVIDIR
jgi:hypothetical protein